MAPRARSTMSALIISAISFLSIPCFVTASSTPKPPLHHVEHPVVQALEVFPRYGVLQGSLRHRRDAAELHHTDSFRLTISAFDDTFHLHLRPNDDLVHPAARINYYRPGPDGSSQLYRTEPLLREDVRAYWGEVISDADSPRRLLEDAAGGLYRPKSPAPSVLGWARVLVHSTGSIELGMPPSFEGAFSVNGDVHHVSTTDSYLRTKRPDDPHPESPEDPLDSQLVIFRNSDMYHDSDFESLPRSCAHDSLPYNTDPRLNPSLRSPLAPPPWYDPLDLWSSNSSLSRRDDIGSNGDAPANNFINNIGDIDGCPKTQQIVYMGVAADCTYVSNYGSPQNATSAILKDWNSATARYKTTFNVSLGIVQLDVHDAACPQTPPDDAKWNVACNSAITLNDRLSLFSEWRGEKGNDGIGLWHLMSGCPTGTEVGVAWLSTLCQQTASGSAPNIVSGTAVSTAGPTEWEVVTHEIGHNFGAIHDCSDGCTLTDNCCPSSASTCSSSNLFIMNPTSSPSETQFSPCTIGNICTSLKNALNTTCMVDLSANVKQTITFQMCGNGIVEDGEDCDPGQDSSSNCCDAATCKFKGDAQCDPASSPCCTSQCAFSAASTVCRPAMDTKCDMPEMCTGKSADCPADQTKPNGMACGTDSGEQLTCASGICTSVGQQCRLMGASLNLTRACSQQANAGCQVSCQDPKSPDRCLVLQATLPNGSACGYGGTCGNGNCQPGNLISTAKVRHAQFSMCVLLWRAIDRGVAPGNRRGSCRTCRSRFP
ncbi:hypothetical protein EXIGLDRAFT_448707 [Exidia glandulosa HHB12029]|uniref:Disintegrin and metalloproteinase domain-containing protein B n=1 Tax=Exidia glandulosa HHB12029 TaxID=1314781 RepID=A0A165B4T1_EXIGL|nr:hypothetical protein EXIGLDRAFT_448707 [Exidia glandulosa HHB12029]